MRKAYVALLAAMVAGLGLAVAEDAPVTVPLANPDFKDEDKNGIPDGWKDYPAAAGTQTSIAADPAGGTHLVDNDEGNGIGIAQWVPVTPGAQYIAGAEVQGTGSIGLYLIFVPSIPSKEAQVSATKLAEAHISLPATPAPELKVTAPAGANFARLWFYCPKIGKCDVVVKSVYLKTIGGTTTPLEPKGAKTPKAAGAGGGTPAVVVEKPRNDNGRDNPSSMLKEGTINTVDFETGDFTQARSLEGGKKEVVSAPEPVRNGAHAMKVMLTHDQHRTEMTGPRSDAYGEFKYGWSIYIPKEFDGQSWFSIVTQWHSWGSGRDYIISPPGPPTCLVISKDTWHLDLRYQDGDTNKAAQKIFPIGPIDGDRGKWTDFMMEVNWQSPKTGGGYVRLYKNGEKVVDYQGPTWFDEKTSGPFFKMGIYKGGSTWKGEEAGAILYFDEFRMGGKTASLNDVDPAKHAKP